MPYDDIRFSGWDDPDDDDIDVNDVYDPRSSDDNAGMYWEYPAIIGEEEVYFTVIDTCEMCGAVRHVDMTGLCHMCASFG